MKKFIRKYTPRPEKLREQKVLSVLGERIYSPNLWHINRHSVAGAVALGFFWCWIPVPAQMVFSAICAIIFSVNLPIAVALVWITNPITIPPLFYFAYWVGAKILQVELEDVEFEFSAGWLTSTLGQIWQPFIFGSLVVAVICAVLGFVITKGLWRYHTVRRLQFRRKRNKRT